MLVSGPKAPLSVVLFAFMVLVVPLAHAQAQAPLGTFRLSVDASHAPQKILHAHEQIPVQPGELTLYYPEWIPGEHMPDGPIINVAGMKFTAGGQTLRWQRDLVDMFAIHLDIPPGANSLDVDLDFLLSAPASGFSAGASATASLDVLSWNQVLLYPKGYAVHDLIFVPSLKIPAGWTFGTALPGGKQTGTTIDFSPVPLNTLVDSPVLTGRYFRRIDLTPGQEPDHEMDIASDSPAALAMPPEMELHFRNLVAETGALFEIRHYRDYHFLLTLSDDVAHFGLEHHESSDDRTSERSLIDPGERLDFAGLLPHEFVHSWNGKYRRPAGLATPDYQQPMKDDLLWVYEGLTEYLGNVLTARTGLWTDEQYREALSYLIATYEHRPGRDWRPLQDTANAAPFLYDAGTDWANWRRGTDFYEEGEMLWLDVDTTIRHLTEDRKSMNDFCKTFYAGPSNQPALKTYTFEELVSALNSIAPYDWTGFFRGHLDSLAPSTPLESIENAGWKLVYNEQPNEIERNQAILFHTLDLSFSIGATVREDGVIVDVTHGEPSYNAGIGPGMKITGVNGRQFSLETLEFAIDAAKNSKQAIQLTTANGPELQTISIDYHGGLLYPHMQRETNRPDYLSEILHPLSPATQVTSEPAGQ
ncbi:MAG TPA: PDZ domain-containing protein [Candidatus Cybelea sp.]|nr:PDZ domain-containing protein [Candidatus Cybelea sp.]